MTTEAAQSGEQSTAAASETSTLLDAAQAETTTEQTTTEQSAAEGQTKGAEGEQQQPEGAPEKYDFKAPEGKAYDTATLDGFAEVAKELNLSQDNAQKVLDKMAPLIAQRQQAQVDTVSNEWVAAARADKEFGGDKLSENLATAKAALEKFGSPELSKMLNETKLGNNPEVIRLLVRVGKAISEDTIVSDKANSGGKQTKQPGEINAQSLYANSNMK